MKTDKEIFDQMSFDMRSYISAQLYGEFLTIENRVKKAFNAESYYTVDEWMLKYDMKCLSDLAHTIEYLRPGYLR